MNVYVFLGLLLLAYAFCAFVLFISGFIVKSRGLKIVAGIALGPVVAALLLLVIAVGMGGAPFEGPCLGLRTRIPHSSAARSHRSAGSCHRNE